MIRAPAIWNTYFLICWISLTSTSFKGFSFTGLGAFFSCPSTSIAGDCGMWAAWVVFLSALAALRFLREGRTRVRPDLVVVGRDDDKGLWEEEGGERAASIALCGSGSFCPQSCLANSLHRWNHVTIGNSGRSYSRSLKV